MEYVTHHVRDKRTDPFLDMVDPLPIRQHLRLVSLPFMIRMRAGSGLMEQVSRNGYYITFITVPFFMSSQLLLNETNISYYSTLMYLNPCTS